MTKRPCPRFVVVDDTGDTEPMTTDILVDLFDFGIYTERDLDLITKSMDVGDLARIKCSTWGDADEDYWTISLRRVE